MMSAIKSGAVSNSRFAKLAELDYKVRVISMSAPKLLLKKIIDQFKLRREKLEKVKVWSSVFFISRNFPLNDILNSERCVTHKNTRNFNSDSSSCPHLFD